MDPNGGNQPIFGVPRLQAPIFGNPSPQSHPGTSSMQRPQSSPFGGISFGNPQGGAVQSPLGGARPRTAPIFGATREGVTPEAGAGLQNNIRRPAQQARPTFQSFQSTGGQGLGMTPSPQGPGQSTSHQPAIRRKAPRGLSQTIPVGGTRVREPVVRVDPSSFASPGAAPQPQVPQLGPRRTVAGDRPQAIRRGGPVQASPTAPGYPGDDGSGNMGGQGGGMFERATRAMMQSTATAGAGDNLDGGQAPRSGSRARLPPASSSMDADSDPLQSPPNAGVTRTPSSAGGTTRLGAKRAGRASTGGRGGGEGEGEGVGGARDPSPSTGRPVATEGTHRILSTEIMRAVGHNNRLLDTEIKKHGERPPAWGQAPVPSSDDATSPLTPQWTPGTTPLTTPGATPERSRALGFGDRARTPSPFNNRPTALVQASFGTGEIGTGRERSPVASSPGPQQVGIRPGEGRRHPERPSAPIRRRPNPSQGEQLEPGAPLVPSPGFGRVPRAPFGVPSPSAPSQQARPPLASPFAMPQSGPARGPARPSLSPASRIGPTGPRPLRTRPVPARAGPASVGTNVGSEVEIIGERVHGAVSRVGRCTLMCPPSELPPDNLCTSMGKRGAHKLEKVPGKPATLCWIKDFDRDPKPDYPEDELRSLSTLEGTVTYMERELMDKGRRGHDNSTGAPLDPDPSWPQPPVTPQESYKFHYDRLRMVIKELTMQNYCYGGKVHVQSLSMIERITRYLIVYMHRLNGLEAFIKEDAKLNQKQLVNTLTSLLASYEYARMNGGGSLCGNEAEFRAYNVLLTGDVGAARLTGSQADAVSRSPEVRFAMSVLLCKETGNYARFFRMLRTAPYLVACLMAKYAKDFRSKALGLLFTTLRRNPAYRLPDQTVAVPLPLPYLVHALCFKDDSDAMDYVAARPWLQLDASSDPPRVFLVAMPEQDPNPFHALPTDNPIPGDGDDAPPEGRATIAQELLLTFPFLPYIEDKAAAVPMHRLTTGQEGRFMPTSQAQPPAQPTPLVRPVLVASPRPAPQQVAPASPVPLHQPQPLQSPFSSPSPLKPQPPAFSPSPFPVPGAPVSPFAMPPSLSLPATPLQPAPSPLPSPAVVDDSARRQEEEQRKHKEAQEAAAQKREAEARKKARRQREEQKQNCFDTARVGVLSAMDTWVTCNALTGPAAASVVRAMTMEREYYLRLLRTVERVFGKHLDRAVLAKKRAFARLREHELCQQRRSQAQAALSSCLDRLTARCAKRHALCTWTQALQQVRQVEADQLALLDKQLHAPLPSTRRSWPPTYRRRLALTNRQQAPVACLDLASLAGPSLVSTHVAYFASLSDPQYDAPPPQVLAWKLLLAAHADASPRLFSYTCSKFLQRNPPLSSAYRRRGTLYCHAHPLPSQGLPLQLAITVNKAAPASGPSDPLLAHGCGGLVYVLSDKWERLGKYWAKEAAALHRTLLSLFPCPGFIPPLLLLVPRLVLDQMAAAPHDVSRLVTERVWSSLLPRLGVPEDYVVPMHAVAFDDGLGADEHSAAQQLSSGVQWLAAQARPNPAIERRPLSSVVEEAVTEQLWQELPMSSRVMAEVTPQDAIAAVNSALDRVTAACVTGPEDLCWPIPELADKDRDVPGSLWQDQLGRSLGLPLDWNNPTAMAKLEGFLQALRLPDLPDHGGDAVEWLNRYLKVLSEQGGETVWRMAPSQSCVDHVWDVLYASRQQHPSQPADLAPWNRIMAALLTDRLRAIQPDVSSVYTVRTQRLSPRVPAPSFLHQQQYHDLQPWLRRGSRVANTPVLRGSRKRTLGDVSALENRPPSHLPPSTSQQQSPSLQADSKGPSKDSPMAAKRLRADDHDEGLRGLLDREEERQQLVRSSKRRQSDEEQAPVVMQVDQLLKDLAVEATNWDQTWQDMQGLLLL